MRRFVLITLAIVIVLILLRNTEALAATIQTVTGIFGKSFKAVTSADKFK